MERLDVIFDINPGGLRLVAVRSPAAVYGSGNLTVTRVPGPGVAALQVALPSS